MDFPSPIEFPALKCSGKGPDKAPPDRSSHLLLLISLLVGVVVMQKNEDRGRSSLRQHLVADDCSSSGISTPSRTKAVGKEIFTPPKRTL